MHMRTQFAFAVVLLLLCSGFVLAQELEGNDIKVHDFELEKLLSFGSGILALILFFLTRAAYKRTHSKRLSYVSIAFLLFALKGFFIAHELFFTEWPLIDIFSNVLDFAILLTFFFGIIKK